MISVSRTQLQERLEQISEPLRDEIFSDANDEVVLGLVAQYSFSEQQHKKLSYLCLLVFLGFLRIKDLFEAIQEQFGIDAKTALAIHEVLKQNVFTREQTEIEANYKRFEFGVVSGQDISQIKTQEQIILKKDIPQGAVDLSTARNIEHTAWNTQNAAKINTNEKEEKIIDPSMRSNGSAPISINDIPLTQKPIINKQPLAPTPEASAQHNTIVSQQASLTAEQSSLLKQTSQQNKQNTPDGPVVLHKKEEISSVGQLNAVKGYKQMSFGSFMGSFKTPQDQQARVSHAEVEIPGVPRAQEAQSQQVPFSVKKYDSAPVQPSSQKEEVAKVVHYTFDGNQR